MFSRLPVPYDAFEPASESGGPLPSFSSILFPDFEGGETSADALPEAFAIDDLDMASWAVAKILESEARIEQRSRLAKEFKSRIDGWLASANRRDDESVSRLSFLLEPYVRKEISNLRNSRTLSLPTGLASLRRLPDRLDIIDGDEAIAYCEAEHPEAIIVRKEHDKARVKDLILHHAEPIPGIAAELGSDKLYVKPLKIRPSALAGKEAA